MNNNINKKIIMTSENMMEILKKYNFKTLDDLSEFCNAYYNHKCPEIICDDCGDTVDESGCICPNVCKRESCDNYDEDEENELCRDCNRFETKGILEELSDHNIYCLYDLKTFFNEFDKYLGKLNSKGINGFDQLMEMIDDYQVKKLNIKNNTIIEFNFHDYIYDIRYKRKLYYHKKRNNEINNIFNEKKNKDYKNNIENINIKYNPKIYNKVELNSVKEKISKHKIKILNVNNKMKELEYLYEEGIKMEKQVRFYFDKLTNEPEIIDIFKDEKVKKIINEYEKSFITETELSCKIGELFVNNKISKNDQKEFNKLTLKTRPAREILKCKRTYLLEEFCSIKNIALSGISNFLRDASDEKFEFLLSLFNK